MVSYIIKPVLCHLVLVTAQSTRLWFHLRSKKWRTRNCVWCSPSSSPMLLSKSPYSKSDSTCQAQGSKMSGRDRRCRTKQFCFGISILHDVSIVPTNMNSTIKPKAQLEHKHDLANSTPKICSRRNMPVEFQVLGYCPDLWTSLSLMPTLLPFEEQTKIIHMSIKD